MSERWPSDSRNRTRPVAAGWMPTGPAAAHITLNRAGPTPPTPARPSQAAVTPEPDVPSSAGVAHQALAATTPEPESDRNHGSAEPREALGVTHNPETGGDHAAPSPVTPPTATIPDATTAVPSLTRPSLVRITPEPGRDHGGAQSYDALSASHNPATGRDYGGAKSSKAPDVRKTRTRTQPRRCRVSLGPERFT